MATAASSLALYGYEEWRTGLVIATLSLVLFIVDGTIDMDFIPQRYLSSSQAGFLFMVNSTMTFVISAYCIVMMHKLNYESEKGLLETQKLVEMQIAELKKTNSELDRFVYSASHDLRAPLSSISGLITIMQQEKGANNPLYISLMKDRVKAMDEFIREIVDYSRNARLEPEMKKFRLHELIDEIVNSLTYFENADKVSIEVHVSEDLDLYSDKERLRIVLNNLMTNSIKYADFSKERPFIQVTASRSAQAVLLEVKDNGIGITDAHTARVFEMFYRATERSKGSGLGLYIAKEVVEKLGGKLAMHSEVNVGSCFSIELPAFRAV
ncbi:MAG: HAMP domain-containing sensor histidine kinase [Cytophagales bacterium]|nr:HAMP domain-containing sensor histidine kinase [Cytophagales bacterium]